MKKILFILSALSVILISLASCTFEFSETKLSNRPDYKISKKGIIITLRNSNSDTKYVNIYRQEYKINDGDSQSSEITNIGIVFPKENDSTFIYEDNYLVKDHQYRYRARFYSEVDGYTFTEWTEPCQAVNGIGDTSGTIRLTYGVPENTKLVYNEKEKKITVDGTLIPPSSISTLDDTDEFHPALIFESAIGTRAFEVPSVDNGEVILLSDILPLDFQNTDIKLLGLVAQKIEKYTPKKSNEEIKQRIIWSPIAKISFVGTDNLPIQNNTIFFRSEHGDDGFDYSGF